VNEKGQILLPGLAWFLGLVTVFFILVTWGWRQLSQERMDTAASAAALSAARALASQLNECATRNLEANAFVSVSYDGKGLIDPARVDPFEIWLDAHELEDTFQSVFSGFKGNAKAVGSQVAKLNGANKNICQSSLNLRLQLNDMKVLVLPTLAPMDFQDVYYTRLWGDYQQKVQPPHLVVWSASDGISKSVAAAKVYLDVESDALQNGGFPPQLSDDALGKFEIQSLWPQFNAKLAPVPLENQVLNRVI
jgi:hypothetical protein